MLPLDLPRVLFDGGSGYVLGKDVFPEGVSLPSDDADRRRRSEVRLLEDGKSLGPAHSIHSDIRAKGGGRFSHFGGGLWFSASDNSDPRRNGRAYAIAWAEPFAPWFGWWMLVLGAGLVVSARPAWVAGLRAFAARARDPDGAGGRLMLSAAAPQLALFAAVAAAVLALGMERSAPILVTQPFEVTQATNTVLGSSLIRDGSSILPLESGASLQQLEFLAGAEIAPDSVSRHPLYALLALLLAPLAGVVAAMIAINVLAWAVAVWACHRFARAFTRDELAAKWAALLAIVGMGFAAHVLEPGPRLLSFALYMAGVAAIFESGAWSRRVDLGAHLRIGALLALACLQDDTGLVLVAGYVACTIRHNAKHTVPVALAALATQPAWAAVVAAIHRGTEAAPTPWILEGATSTLARAWAEWRLAGLGKHAAPLLAFEAPWIIAGGVIALAACLARHADRGKAAFALAFIALSVAAALFVAPVSETRAPLVYGIAIFCFAGTGAILAGLIRMREPVFAPVAVIVVVLGAAWSTAHLGGVNGPAKAYFQGYVHAKPFFSLAPAPVQTLTNTDPIPRVLGGAARLTTAGLAGVAGRPPQDERKRAGSSLVAAGLLSVAVVAFAAMIAGASGPVVALAAVVVAGHAVLAGRGDYTHVPVAPVDSAYRLASGKTAEYRVWLGGDVRKAILDRINAGAFAILCPGFLASGPPPTVSIDGEPIKVADPIGPGNWRLDTSDLFHAMRRKGAGVMTVRFKGGDDVRLAGWQRFGLPGRLFAIDGAEPALRVLPAIEIRLIRDSDPRVPELVAY